MYGWRSVNSESHSFIIWTMVSQKKNTPAASSHDHCASDKPAAQQAAGSRERRPSDKVAAQRKSVSIYFKSVKRRPEMVPNARKMDGSELLVRNTLEGTEHGKGAEVRNEVRKQGEMRNV